MANYIEAGYNNLLTKGAPEGGLNNITIDGSMPDGTIDFGKTTINEIKSGQTISSEDFVTGVSGWRINGNGDAEFSSGTFRGALSASTIDIGGTDATSFHVDIDGNIWSGSATFNQSTNPFSVSNAGNLSVIGGTIIGPTFKTSDVTYPDVLINTTGITVHGENLSLAYTDGTLTGTLGAQGTGNVRLSSEANKNLQLYSGSGGDIELSCGGNVYLKTDGGATELKLNTGGGMLFSTAAADSVSFDCNVKPNADSSYDLGESAKRWTNIYTDNSYVGDLVFFRSYGTGSTVDGSMWYDSGSNALFFYTGGFKYSIDITAA